MKRRMFVSLLLLQLVFLLIFSAVLGVFVCDDIADRRQKQTQSRLDAIACGVRQAGLSYLSELDSDQGDILWTRDGEILFCSSDGETYRSRNSALCTKTLADGSVLALNLPRLPAYAPLLFALAATAVLMLPAALLSYIFSAVWTKRIARNIGQIDMERPDACPVYPEFSPLMKKIERQNDVIHQQMNQLREESARREDMRREFTANVSHELKTPLTTISGTAEILQSGMVRTEDVPHFAGNIYHEAQRMNTLVSDILELSQLEEGKTMTSNEPVNLLELCGEIAGWLHDEADKKQIAVSVSGVPAEIIGVRKVLDEMISNLCINSIKYNHPGGHVWVRVERNKEHVILSVQDDGIGIPPEHQERVFERFYRVDKSHSREIGGTGLGLSIVKHAAIYHNASIELHSEEHVGTTVRILFPLLASDSAAARQ